METKELIEQLRECGGRGCAECQYIEECVGPGWLMLKAADRLDSTEKLDRVIAGLECCQSENMSCAENCPYFKGKYELDGCMDDLMAEALEVLLGLSRRA